VVSDFAGGQAKPDALPRFLWSILGDWLVSIRLQGIFIYGFGVVRSVGRCVVGYLGSRLLSVGISASIRLSG